MENQGVFKMKEFEGGPLISPADYANHCLKKNKYPTLEEYKKICKRILRKNKADATTPANKINREINSREK